MKTNRWIISPLTALSLAFWAVGVFAAEPEKSADPLGDVVLDMQVATKWLSKATTNAITQETQKDAVERLDALIIELEKQRQQMGNGGNTPRNPTNPMQDSMVHGGPGGQGKMRAPQDNGKHWAELPPHERERIMQSMTEGFPAHYQNVLESYFKRVAEEKTVKADDAAPPPKKSSAAPARATAPASGPATSGPTTSAQE
jgi:hypothetical protein